MTETTPAPGEKVSVFVCGVQKGGTTSLFEHMREHPDLSPPSQKEIHFFDDETRNWSKPDHASLNSFFSTGDGGRRRFEITPIYCFWPPAMQRIHAYNRGAKLIFLFRDPFERAWSQWQMEFARGDENLPFAEAIRGGRQRLEGLPPLARERRVYTYIERGFYAAQVARALTWFPRGQLLFLRSRDLLTDHVGTLRRIAGFLDIGAFPDTGAKRANARPAMFASASPTEADRAYVATILRDNVSVFSRLSGIDVADWPIMRR